MIPKTDLYDLQDDLYIPSLTYYIDVEKGRMIGHVDELEAVAQAAMKILRTERYSSVLYSTDYGVELEKYIGQDIYYIEADLERAIEEALIMDDRITGIDNFEFKQVESDAVEASFTVLTIFGEFDLDYEVEV